MQEKTGMRDKFLDYVEEMYGIPKGRTENLTYDQINDLIYEETKRRERAKKS